MRLIKLQAKNFRSLKELCITFVPFTILIGENDAGKSSVLDLLELCLSARNPDINDYYQDDTGKQVDTIEAILCFYVVPQDAEAQEYALAQELRVKYQYQAGSRELWYWGESPRDNRLNIPEGFTKLGADAQKNLIEELDSTVSANDISNAQKRIDWFHAYYEQAPKEQAWIKAPNKWGAFLPRFERYSAMDYNAPENLIAKTLKRVFEQAIFEDVEQNGNKTRRLIAPLLEVEATASQRMREEIEKLESSIKQYNRRIQNLGYEPRFDFTNSVQTGNLQVNTGRGLHVLSKTGAGTRRRMFMGILDWDRQVALEEARTGELLPTVIRGYDETDTNLHYEAQRRMYAAIEEIVQAENSNVQALICTHSLTMIDRAPAQSIRLFSLCDDGHTVVSQLHTDDDTNVERFLSNLAREMGITNSLIFYERCFILIEGETEENALPLMYRRLYGRSLLEDGIRIINVKGNGAVKEFLKLLSRNRKELTIVFVDNDTKQEKAAKLTEQALQDAGFDDAFIQGRLLFTGENEFEDTFTNDVLAGCLNSYWPKIEGTWTIEEINHLRTTGKKFSDEIKRLIWTSCAPDGESWSKPIFGQKLAEDCLEEHVPEDVLDLFELARQVAGVSTRVN